MTLKVIGAGFGRTGTMSLKLALEQLGFGPCYHMIEVFKMPGAAQHWIDAADGKPMDWDKVFKGFGSTVDFPACIFYRELAALYPDAKIILTERDPESWFASTQATIFSPRMPERLQGMPIMAKMIGKIIGETMQGKLNDHDGAIAIYNAHNEAVKRMVPADRLLTYNVVEGWGPLCAFLDVAEPATPFPKVNTRDEFGQMASKLAR